MSQLVYYVKSNVGNIDGYSQQELQKKLDYLYRQRTAIQAEINKTQTALQGGLMVHVGEVLELDKEVYQLDNTNFCMKVKGGNGKIEYIRKCDMRTSNK